MIVRGQDKQQARPMQDGEGSAGHARLRAAICDYHQLCVDGVSNSLDTSADFEVVVRATTAEQLLHAINKIPADVLLIDPWGPSGDGLDTISRISKSHPAIVIVALSGVSDAGHVKRAIASGADGYVGKDTSAADLPTLLRLVMTGSMVQPSGKNRSADPCLTEREAAVLTQAACGKSNAEIGQALFITEQTVKFHLSNIYRKMGVCNRTEAAHHAMRDGLIS